MKVPAYSLEVVQPPIKLKNMSYSGSINKRGLLIGTFLILSFSSFSQEVKDSTFWHYTKIGITVSNGFYDVKQVDSSRYKSGTTQITYGINFSNYLRNPRIRSLFGLFFTHDKFLLQEKYQVPNAIRDKNLNFLDGSFQMSFDFIKIAKLRANIIIGLSYGYSIGGQNEAHVGLFGQNNSLYPSGIAPVQFNIGVLSSIIGLGMDYDINEKISLRMNVINKYYFDYISAYDKNNNPFVNVLFGINYRLDFTR
jgi:hypothetical protein